MNVKATLGYFSTVRAQLLLMIFSGVSISYLVYVPTNRFDTNKRESFILKVTPDVVSKWGKDPIRVKTGFFVHEFLQFDTIKNSFLVNAIISFEFDPTKVSQESIDKFSFTKGEIVRKSDPVVKKISDTRTFVQYYIRVQFSTLFDYKLFPLDDHKISLNLTNNALEAEDVIFDVHDDEYTVPQYLFLAGWKIVAHKATSGYAQFSALDATAVRHPKVIFSISLEKKDYRQLFMLLFPMLVIFYFCLFTLSFGEFDLNVESMVALATAFMASAIVAQSMSPAVGYFMLIDYLILFFLSAMLVIFVIHFLYLINNEESSVDVYAAVRGGAIIGLYVSFIVLVYYLTHVY